MLKLPIELLDSLEGVEGFERNAFIQAHESAEQVTSVRINPQKWDQNIPLDIEAKVPWSEYGYYLNSRPSFTFDPFFHAGCYYVQEASSMFLEQAFKQLITPDQSIKVLDLSAAPGGKSTHIQSLITADSLLVSNEVIKTRANTLKQNIIKWGAENVIVTSSDPQQFSFLNGFFDVVVVDAPCSGSGLFRRDPDAIKEWSKENVMLCCGRQQRILADVLPCLKENGILIYSTCSYSREEDEDISTWLVEHIGMESLELRVPEEWNIVQSTTANSRSYRFYPGKTKGEGFYMSCFRKKAETSAAKIKQQKPSKATPKEVEVINNWIDTGGLTLLKHKDSLFALPSNLVDALHHIQSSLYVVYPGLALGEVIREKFIPDHALAMSKRLNTNIPKADLSYEDAIRFLQRQDIPPLKNLKGWVLASYKGVPLGWMNVLPGRINNYYPKDLRILKGFNDSSFKK